MDPMASAIKSRRGGLLSSESPKEEMVEMSVEGSAKPEDMMSLVRSLSEDQKSLLLNILVKDQNGQGMEKGEPGPGEMAEMEEEVEMPEGEGHESEDEIMESMISSADKMRAQDGSKPRNLGERVKMNMASKLNNKKKGY